MVGVIVATLIAAAVADNFDEAPRRPPRSGLNRGIPDATGVSSGLEHGPSNGRIRHMPNPYSG